MPKRKLESLAAGSIAEDAPDSTAGADSPTTDTHNKPDDVAMPDQISDLNDNEAEKISQPAPRRGRGRPKGSKNKRPTTPPRDLPAYERYFHYTKGSGPNTSSNTFPSQRLRNHEDFFAWRRDQPDGHADEKKFLRELHKRSFAQWDLELRSGYNICLYGFGSKRQVTRDFASKLWRSRGTRPKIVVVNGYDVDLDIHDVLDQIASLLFPANLKLPTQPVALVSAILEALDTQLKGSNTLPRITMIVNSLDARPLRSAKVQTLFGMLAAHPRFSLVATCDTPMFPLLWDQRLREQFRFVFHDATTFAPFEAEVNVVDAVNGALGRLGKRLGGKDGIAFVLRSLPGNARSLFRLLVAEQLAESIDLEDAMAGPDEDDDEMIGDMGDLRGRTAADNEGVDFRLLYQKAAEELICTNEHQYRTLLKEFFDHQMIESKRDATGSERLVVPFRREELEALLEDLVGELAT